MAEGRTPCGLGRMVLSVYPVSYACARLVSVIQALNTFLERQDVQTYLNRPRIKPILIFTALGLLVSFIRALVIDPNGGSALPLLNLWDSLSRLAVYSLWFLGVVMALRPGRHSVAEGVLWIAVSLSFVYYLIWADRPAAALMIFPIVARHWLTMRQALVLLLGLLLATVIIYLMIPPVPSFNTPEAWAGLVVLVVITVSQGAFTYTAFELLVQNEGKQQALNAANLELHETQASRLQAAALEERTFISRELHDTLGHELAALRLEVQRARKLETKMPSPSAPVLEALEGAMNRSGRALEQLQTVVSALRTPKLDGTLFDALQDLVQAWPNAAELTFESAEPPLTTSQKLAFYRGAQETLTNAYKHAPNQRVQLSLSRQGDQLLMMGCNEKAESAQVSSVMHHTGGRSGLAQLKTRFQEMGGDVVIQDQEDEFTVWLTLPITA